MPQPTSPCHPQLPFPPGTIASWVKEMAGFVKSLDGSHLLTVRRQLEVAGSG